MRPLRYSIDTAKKHVVSSTRERVDWNAELLRGDLATAVQQLERESGKGLFVGGVKLPQALAELGLIDEYELVVHPRLAGPGPTLFAGRSEPIDLKLLSRVQFRSGAAAMRYEPRRQATEESGRRRDSPENASRIHATRNLCFSLLLVNDDHRLRFSGTAGRQLAPVESRRESRAPELDLVRPG